MQQGAHYERSRCTSHFATVKDLIDGDIAAAVAQAALITSPYVANGRVQAELNRLVERVQRLLIVRPDFFESLAKSLEVEATVVAVEQAIRDQARRLMERQMERHLPPGVRA